MEKYIFYNFAVARTFATFPFVVMYIIYFSSQRPSVAKRRSKRNNYHFHPFGVRGETHSSYNCYWPPSSPRCYQIPHPGKLSMYTTTVTLIVQTNTSISSSIYHRTQSEQHSIAGPVKNGHKHSVQSTLHTTHRYLLFGSPFARGRGTLGRFLRDIPLPSLQSGSRLSFKEAGN